MPQSLTMKHVRYPLEQPMSHGVQAGFGGETSAQPAGMVTQSGSSRMKRSQRARSKRFLRANTLLHWISTPLELSGNARELWRAVRYHYTSVL